MPCILHGYAYAHLFIFRKGADRPVQYSLDASKIRKQNPDQVVNTIKGLLNNIVVDDPSGAQQPTRDSEKDDDSKTTEKVTKTKTTPTTTASTTTTTPTTTASTTAPTTRRRPVRVTTTRRTTRRTTTPRTTTTTPTPEEAGYLARIGSFVSNSMNNFGSSLVSGTSFLAAAAAPLWVPLAFGKKKRRKRDLQTEKEQAMDQLQVSVQKVLSLSQ